MDNEVTFGQRLAQLRGRERPVDVARRVRFEISPLHLRRLEDKATAIGIEIKTLMLLAEAYWQGNYASEEVAFWDLWQRAGYALPQGFPMGLRDLGNDVTRYNAIKVLMDMVSSWRTDEIERLVLNIEERRERDARRLGVPDVAPPVTSTPGH